ncbi:hypothetical protein CFP65_2313 [Kitasatospora sp. MMS16-BH015]|uniref:hypothetical protein n=1 Tax=Kitasatospora sp. MMS16-BH015 TaxID=2018025 RepID=UPI000CA195C8|nr:hypothetical protein [Kitasatospora sp. MMS16-BH015]AUG77151.1 hypothetical protein CFP65_2313 [Kitasatospora sp. MMS16-BH015]
MTHQLRAELGPDGQVLKWHVVRDAEPTAMCGREIAADAEARDEAEWGTGLRGCQQCGSLYMHEAPHYPGDPHR